MRLCSATYDRPGVYVIHQPFRYFPNIINNNRGMVSLRNTTQTPNLAQNELSSPVCHLFVSMDVEKTRDGEYGTGA